jgi:hypothetical protein
MLGFSIGRRSAHGEEQVISRHHDFVYVRSDGIL